MATVEAKKNKDGEIIAYRITVAEGMNSKGQQIRRRKTWKPPRKNMTERQIAKALELAKAEFELEVRAGYQLDHRQTFAQYAEYVIDLKERNGIKTSTIDQYIALSERTYQAIGHLKLADIRPQHLNAFYKNLSEEGIRKVKGSAAPKIDIRGWLKKNGHSITGFARQCELAASTLRAAADGKTIREDSAAKIAHAMNMDINKVFTITKNKTKLSPTTIAEYHRFISTVMAQAEKEMLIPYNPAAKASPPSPEVHEPDYYEPETVKQILDELDKAPLKWRAATYLLIDTGCRRGEVMGLKWDSVYLDDPDHAVIMIDKEIQYSPRKGVYEDTTKTKRCRALTIAPETAQLLIEWKAEQDEYREASGDAWIETGYIFTRPDGKFMHPDSLNRWLSAFSRDHNLPYIHPHAFRHTAASIMFANYIDLISVAGELGHADPHTTAKIYAHQITLAKARAGGIRRNLIKR